VDRLAADDAGRLHLEPAQGRAGDRALAVDGLPERVHHPSDQRVADRDREDPTGRLDRLTLLDLLGLTEDDGTDRALVEVEGETEHTALELEQLVDRRLGQPGDAGDAVTDLEHTAHAGGLGRRRERLDVLAQRGCDLVGVDGEFGHVLVASRLRGAVGS